MRNRDSKGRFIPKVREHPCSYYGTCTEGEWVIEWINEDEYEVVCKTCLVYIT